MRVIRSVDSSLAQSVEHLTVNQGVAGSSPAGGAKTETESNRTPFFVLLFLLNLRFSYTLRSVRSTGERISMKFFRCSEPWRANLVALFESSRGSQNKPEAIASGLLFWLPPPVLSHSSPCASTLCVRSYRGENFVRNSCYERCHRQLEVCRIVRVQLFK